uniref:Uncharacterized protein n=1 Tax=Oryza glaberrima TaxID=4538 RepID=I1QSY7_ORYGL
CLPCCRSGKKKGRRRKGKKEAEEIEVKMEMWGLITRCPWKLRIGGIELLIYAAFIGRLSVICLMLFGVGSQRRKRDATSECN